ncbi:hypothetical protein N7495_008193 [Penicillium taxi]|uniref:uncharacterized protein n=1 Tax=Penicillium taxi TaxID=168475 RepID=UPI0025450685|nr:uncharacterized protein N7495_008193 [Penicillium taxi]KAJ5888152.1 hypothetical protein N7495_008193 [Penicillium taxi]
MQVHNTYLKYKRDQANLIFWIIHTSNSISKKLSPDAGLATNASSISLTKLNALSALIVKYVDPIPATIFRLFESVIDARRETSFFYLNRAASDPDPDIQKSNESHKHWINGLTEAFNTLGGENWQSMRKGDPLNEDETEAIFANQFSTLSLDSERKDVDNEEIDGDRSEEDTDIEEDTTPAAPKRSKQKSTKKGKGKGKGKRRARKPKTKGKKGDAVSTPDLRDVPLESYRIIEDETGTVTDYLMAIYSLTHQLIELRHYIQGIWREVAYQNLNSAVAANLSNVAIMTIKDTQSQIFVDFPGHDSFDIVMKTLTRGNPEKSQGMFHMQVWGGDRQAQQDIDVREEFLLNCHQDLSDFIADYQATRSGKPTKAMLKSIQNWDPKMDLQRASKEQRLKWRRAYTINWLYDLVNVFSSIVVQRRTLKGQKISLESVNWAKNGPWSEHRRLYGLNEFAGDITHLAVQKPGTDVQSKILPHHVFQLQCIVDSLTVSRGWSVSILTGHVLKAPAAAFRPRRDVDLFMDREGKQPNKGFCGSVDVLDSLFDHDAMLHGDPNRNASLKVLLVELRQDMINWLGESKYMYGLTTIPPSRFSNTNSNGLWEYSPFLCGSGLSEALEEAYGMGMLIWEKVPEPMCIIHLHNMLVQKRLIARPVGLWSTLEFVFQDSFFFNGNKPTSHFVDGMLNRTVKRNTRQETFRNRAGRQQLARSAEDLNELLDPGFNRFFKTRSLLQVYRRADWMTDRIPDEETALPSLLGFIKLSKAKRSRNTATGQVTLAETDLVRRARLKMSDKEIINMSSKIASTLDQTDVSELVKTAIPEGYTMTPARKPGPNVPAYLNLIKYDLTDDICGEIRPLSSLNYIMVLSRCYVVFCAIEDRLRACRNPSWVMAYETESVLTNEKRVSLTMAALKGNDPECLEIIADVFEEQRGGFMDHIYWKDLVSPSNVLEQETRKPSTPLDPDSCSIM